MQTKRELEDQLTHKRQCIQDILDKVEKENRHMTDAEALDQDAMFADANALQVEINKLDEHEARVAKTKASTDAMRDRLKELAVPEPRAVPHDAPGSDSVTTTINGERRITEVQARRVGKLMAFTGPDRHEQEYRAYVSGQWARATLFGDQRAVRWCQQNGIETRALAEGVNISGGFLVPDEMSAAIIDNREQFGVFRRECNVIPMGRDLMNVPAVLTGLTATFAAENADTTESDPTWTNQTLTAKKMSVLTRISSELMEDAIIDLGDTLAFEIARAFAELEDTIGFVGAGTAAHGGVMGMNTIFSNTNGLAGAVDTATANANLFSELALLDFHTLMSALPEYASFNAKWYCSKLCFDGAMSRLTAAGAGNTIQTLEGGFQRSFLGHEVVISQVMPAGVATDYNNLSMLLFGDLRRASIMGDRRNITIGLSDHIYFVEDQIAIKGTSRIDVTNHGFGTTTVAGPMVGLIGTT